MTAKLPSALELMESIIDGAGVDEVEKYTRDVLEATVAIVYDADQHRTRPEIVDAIRKLMEPSAGEEGK